MRIAVLMTCYNRVETTLECLRRLFAARCPDGVLFDVWLNDDGSTDGTGEKCREFFAVRSAAGWCGESHIVQGSGNDYWCGGMRRAWKAASASGTDYVGYLWLNDDTFVFEDAIEMALENEWRNSAVLVGATESLDESGRATYSGRNRNGEMLVPSGKCCRVWGMNGNFVWVPKAVYARLGNFPDYFTHALGDFDYGKRAIELGIAIYLLPKYVGVCDDKREKTPWMDKRVPFLRRVQNLYSPTGGPEPNVFFRYNLLHFGLVRALRCWVTQHIRVVLPSLERRSK